MKVIGYLDLFRDEWEIDVKDPADVVSMSGQHIISPLPINTGVLGDGYEGLLVQLEGTPVAFERRKRHFWLDDGTGPAYIYVYSPTGIKRRGLKLGTPMTIVGILNQRTEDDSAVVGYRISPRYQFDIIQHLPAPTPVSSAPKGWPVLLPETGFGP